ncbi:DUF3311 domain-containing protein [Brevibacillus choshinensis]|uniref:DUF3311 domain-containing protein n=1 Tax=Brevibacillus choshinensis TaxID=54911 RepID=A0ABR5N132_BRECH|nr:DUF3311 domain-containing protein [Brevibacillus choshinensis]KQL43993.1 hypothetical protein AN963_21345 [Brevibacillus choshinensis]MED4586122.1 DUF3311 domain-containing protein [Brevibacillus choshinensis]MED4754744.1 DUF3311 domain-containing protein [Brevibacillus choshinensis]MED4784733.1 DUF3311 domain-containing protein [Brevibacillus choshinensis]
MSRGAVTITFFIICWLLLSTLVVPPIFRLFNRIEPWVLGMPFVQFWMLFVILVISILLIVWYKVEEKRGEL